MHVKLDVDIPHEETNDYVVIPADLQAWADSLKMHMDQSGRIEMRIDTLAHGCGSCSITFEDGSRGYYPALEAGKVFGFTVSLAKLKELADAFALAYQALQAMEEPA